MKRRVYRLALLLLALCAVFLPLTACGGGEEAQPSTPEPSRAASSGPVDITQLPKLNVCVDIGTNFIDQPLNLAMEALPGNWSEFAVITEQIPYDGAEREATLTRIRTEVLAGKGPDLFLCCGSGWGYRDSRALFPFPEKAMQHRIFLPLDEYMENAQYTDWDDQIPAIMEAGRNEEGQLLVPMRFQVSTLLIPREKGELTAQLPMTWDEMRQSDDPMLRLAGAYSRTSDILGPLGDYRKDAPAFSEERLVEVERDISALHAEASQGAFPELTEYVEEFDFWRIPEDTQNQIFGVLSETDLSRDYWFLPTYNDQGGVTAQITVFGAVNRATDKPETAFRVLDFLMQDSRQRDSIFGFFDGFSTQMELAQEDKLIGGRKLSEWNIQQYNQLMEQINVVNFYTEVNDQLFFSISSAAEEGKSLEDAVHGAYMMISMLLAEA